MANVYKIMIGAPSDIKEEIQVAFDVLKHWNDLNSETNGIVLLPKHWSISTYPTIGTHPQKAINKQVVEKSDLMVCIFGTRLGTPTDTEISGTVEEIKEHRKAGKDVMLFFKLSIDDFSSVDILQLQKITEFKKSIKDDVFWCEYSDSKAFKDLLNDKLQLYINDHWANEQIENKNNKHVSIIDSFSDFDKERIIIWATSSINRSHGIYYSGGYSTYSVGVRKYIVNNVQERAEWDDFYERLIKADFITIEKYDSERNPVYKLKKAAYDYVNELKKEGIKTK